jgi:hypothetical protein
MGGEDQDAKQDQGWFHGVEIVRWAAAPDKSKKKEDLAAGVNLVLGCLFEVDLPGEFRELIVDEFDFQSALRIFGILQIFLKKQIAFGFQFLALGFVVDGGFWHSRGSHERSIRSLATGCRASAGFN